MAKANSHIRFPRPDGRGNYLTILNALIGVPTDNSLPDQEQVVVGGGDTHLAESLQLLHHPIPAVQKPGQPGSQSTFYQHLYMFIEQCSMYELFFQNFNKKVSLTPGERETIQNYLTQKKLRKKQYLLQEGDVCKAIAFVEKGALREYSVDESGSEHIIQFALEGWTISDLYSFLTGEPATYNIDALEDVELVLISKSAHEELLQKVPKYETYTRINITGAYIAMQKRLTSVISSSLEERYADFNALYPAIVQRVPQHMIASYMGLTPETLSRIRKRISAHK